MQHFPCCITNFPQGWPKFAQSTVYYEEPSGTGTGSIVLASLVPLKATVAQAGNASITIESQYPWEDTANISVAANAATTLKLRIPTWATRALVNGKSAPNGTFVTVPCIADTVTVVTVDLRPEVRLEYGWGERPNETDHSTALSTRLVWTCKTGGMAGGDMHQANMTIAAAQAWCGANSKCGGFTTQQAGACGDTGLGALDMHFKDKWGASRPSKDASYSSWTPTSGPSTPTGAANAIGVTRGNLVFALHPTENKTVVRNFSSVPPRPHALDYEIKTADSWNYAIVPEKGATFNGTAMGWSPSFAFDDSGTHPFSVRVTGRRVPKWGLWRGSNITDVPPSSPVGCGAGDCGQEEELVLVPYGSTNIRISVFPWANETTRVPNVAQ